MEKRESSYTIGGNVICYLFNKLLGYICCVLFAIFPSMFMILSKLLFSFLLMFLSDFSFRVITGLIKQVENCSHYLYSLNKFVCIIGKISLPVKPCRPGVSFTENFIMTYLIHLTYGSNQILYFFLCYNC